MIPSWFASGIAFAHLIFLKSNHRERTAFAAFVIRYFYTVKNRWLKTISNC